MNAIRDTLKVQTICVSFDYFSLVKWILFVNLFKHGNMYTCKRFVHFRSLARSREREHHLTKQQSVFLFFCSFDYGVILTFIWFMMRYILWCDLCIQRKCLPFFLWLSYFCNNFAKDLRFYFNEFKRMNERRRET